MSETLFSPVGTLCLQLNVIQTRFSPVGTICVKIHLDINISSLPNQRQMRLGEYAFGIRHDLSGLKRGGIHIFL